MAWLRNADQTLDGLHEIVVPEAISWAPGAVGWYVLFGLFMAGLGWVAFQFFKRRAANRYRKLALEELAGIEEELGSDDGGAAALPKIPVLLKRVALHAGPRETVAALSGGAWLEFLDGSYGGSGFAEGPGRVLPVLAYSRPESLGGLDPKAAAELIGLARTWIETHKAIPVLRGTEGGGGATSAPGARDV